MMDAIKLLKNNFTAGMALFVMLGCAAPEASQQNDTAQQTVSDATLTAAASSSNTLPVQNSALEGAWRMRNPDGSESFKLVQDGFFTVAVYDQAGKRFIGTYGGTISPGTNGLAVTYEFNTFDKSLVGKTAQATQQRSGTQWQVTGIGRDMKGDENWERHDERESPLIGTWRITGRERDGEMNTMRPGPRKTLKVLSGSRFQWIAFNSETGEFSGTGGGTYTATDGRYTENIEFFSRDSSRVGMSLSFDFAVKNGDWHHSGQSSTGNKVYEIWSRINQD